MNKHSAHKAFASLWFRSAILFGFLITLAFMFSVSSAKSAPYAHVILNAKTGEVIDEENSKLRLHPAGLTKLVTLYAVIEALETGEVELDQIARVSAKAAAEGPIVLGLRAGQRISLRYLIRAMAVQGANDAATVIAQTLDGSELAFAERMARVSQDLGLSQSTWRNAHGLTSSGHLSTAQDIAIVMQALWRDYPEYVHLLSRVTVDAGVKKVAHSGRRLLQNYEKALAVKTGFTNASGFSGAMIADHENEVLIVVVLGGRSTKTRNDQMVRLSDLGFKTILDR